jgi:hypothetical protein
VLGAISLVVGDLFVVGINVSHVRDLEIKKNLK